MMTTSRSNQSLHRRKAHTLLEVVLASSISVLLLGTLYVAVDTELRNAQDGREVVETSTLARSLLDRMSADILPELAPVAPTQSDPSSSNNSANSSGQSTTTTPSSPSSSSSTNNNTSTTNSSNSSAVTFNLGVQGDSSQLTLYVSRWPREVGQLVNNGTSDQQVPFSDLRRITYWMVGGNGAPVGLARQEVKVATSTDALNNMPPDIPDEANYVFAPEVQNLTIQYFDGTNWQDSWDGTAVGSDGQTPVGPPTAIALILDIAAAKNNDGTRVIKSYRQVIALPTANGTTTSSGSGSTP
jgi:hypothetical protein